MKKMIPVVLVAMMLISSCTGGMLTIGGQQAVINSFDASPASISAGETATLSWTVTGATTVSIDQGIGNVALTSTRAVAPTTTTTYILSATNSAGTTTATTQVIVAGTAATPTPSPTPTPASPPTVDYFMANPPAITAGGSTTLGWSVSNATSVSIDNGVGSVSSAGTTTVSPALTTDYTLLATNAAGPTGVTITVVVGAAPAAGMPDLIIEDIVRSGDKITYTIKNQGDATAGPSTSTLLVDGATVANDSVGSLAPGEVKTEAFAGYTYSCTLPSDSVQVKADTGNTVVESSEANNSRTETWSCILHLVPIPAFVLKPDLTITTGSLTANPANVAAGGHVTLSAWTVKNVGSIASGDFHNGVYLSTDPVITAADTLLAENSNSSLAAGAEFSWGDGTVTIPLGTPPGNYFIGVLVDRTNAVNESDENNNYVSTSITVH
jgi:hypothetical protein